MPVEYQKQGAAGRRARRHLLVLRVCRGHGTAVTRSAPIGSAVRDERAIAIVAKGSRDHGGRRDRRLADALAASVGAPMIKAIPVLNFGRRRWATVRVGSKAEPRSDSKAI